MSESLHTGYLPLWNPYINFGIPQYADMNAGYWSPITWLIAGTIGYNTYTFTLEVLLYILLSGLGMVTLSSCFTKSKSIQIMAGIAFMCCGYHIGHLQHFNWLSGSAFLPWCLWSYFRFIKKPHLGNILASVLLFYLFIASAHPGLIIGGLYFFIAVAIFLFFSKKKGVPLKKIFFPFLIPHTIFMAAILLLSVGIIVGYTDIIPHFMRGDKPALEDSIQHSSNIKTWLSFILPMSTVKNGLFFITDLSLRNSYFGLVMFIFLLSSFPERKNSTQKLFLSLGIFFLLISAGGFLKNFAYHYFPLIGYVRLGGEFRIFAILSFIIVSVIQLDKFQAAQKPSRHRNIKWIAILLAVSFICCLGWSLYHILITKNSIIYTDINTHTGMANKMKGIIDSLSFYDTIFLQGCIQLSILAIFLHSLLKRKMQLLKWVAIIDLVIASLLNIPFTGAGKTTLSHVQSVLDKSPKGIPIPPVQPISQNDTLAGADNYLLGYWNMYNKQIGTLNEMPYPIQLRNMRAYFDNVENKNGYNYADKPFLYGKNDDLAIEITGFSPNKLTLTVQADSTNDLIFLQNYYPHWYYSNDSGTYKMKKESFNFMRVPVVKGTQKIRLIFGPGFIRTSLLISGLVFVLYFLIIIFYRPKQTYLS
jgi:hypothetical protein